MYKFFACSLIMFGFSSCVIEQNDSDTKTNEQASLGENDLSTEIIMDDENRESE